MRTFLACVTLAVFCIGCNPKKIVLPDDGNRKIIFTESGDEISIQNTEIQVTPLSQRKNSQYQGDLEANANYSGQFKLNKTVTLPKDNLSNLVIVDDIIYYSRHSKIQRYDLKNRKYLPDLNLSISEQTVITSNGQFLVLISQNNTLRIYNLRMNKIVLEKQMEGLVTKRPLIDQNFLYVQDQSDHIFCFDLERGVESWKYEHSKHQTSLFQEDTYSTMVVWRNYIVFIAVNGDVVVLDKNTREPYWVYPSTSVSELILNSSSTPIMVGNDLIVSKKDTGIIRLSLDTRSILWNRPGIQSTQKPCLYGKHLFVATENKIISLDALSGDIYYQSDIFDSRIISEPFILNNQLIVTTANKVYAMNLKNGKITKNLEFNSNSVFPYQEGLAQITQSKIIL